MTYRVVVWGTGNAGRPAIRAVAAHRDLELAGVVVSNPAKVGRDAGEPGAAGGGNATAANRIVNAIPRCARRPRDRSACSTSHPSPGATSCASVDAPG